MTILEYVVFSVLIVAAFIAGMRLDNYYQQKSAKEVKEALERQFVRLRAKADADDPCRPYGTPQWVQPIPLNTGDFDGDGPIGQEFMQELKTSGKAKTSFRKSDLAK